MVALEYQPNVAEVRETPNPISIFHSLSMAQLKLNYCCYYLVLFKSYIRLGLM